MAGGPDAGVIHRIGPGRADVGSGAAAAIRIGDPAVPARALVVSVDEKGGCQVAACPGAAATLDRTQLGAPVPWRPGQQVAVGGTLLGLAACAPADAALCPSADGAGLDFSAGGAAGGGGVAVAVAFVAFVVAFVVVLAAPLSSSGGPLSAPVGSGGRARRPGQAGGRGGRGGRVDEATGQTGTEAGRAGRMRSIGVRCRCWRRVCRW